MENSPPDSIKRRSVLQFAALASGMGMFSEKTLAQKAEASDQTPSEAIGDFEEDLDGWKTNGGNDIFRIDSDEVPAEITGDDYGILVGINGDLFPVIENKRRVQEIDFSENQYLGMRVMGVANQTDSDMVFKFRLHYTPSGGRGNSGGNSSSKGSNSGTPRSKDVNVVESDTKTVPQLQPQTVQWDFGDVSDEKLSKVNRLEIVWYLEDNEPDGGPRGRNTGDFDYEGFVIFDDIQVSSSSPQTESARARQKIINLRREHGFIIDRELDEISGDTERGKLVFSDGTKIDYSFETVGDRKYIKTVDEEEFRIGGGW